MVTVGVRDEQLRTSAKQIVAWFVQRWQLEVTFEEARAHLGVETQHQYRHGASSGQSAFLGCHPPYRHTTAAIR